MSLHHNSKRAGFKVCISWLCIFSQFGNVAFAGYPQSNPPWPCEDCNDCCESICPASAPAAPAPSPAGPAPPPSPPSPPPNGPNPVDTNGPTGPALTSDPINLREGSVNETAVDLVLNGPVLSWKQSRTYRHAAADFGTSRLGKHWDDGMADLRITEPGGDPNWYSSRGDDSTSSPEYELRFSALAVAPMEQGNTTSGITTYEVPSDWHLTVVDDTNNDEFVVRDKYSDKIYVFYDFEAAVDSRATAS